MKVIITGKSGQLGRSLLNQDHKNLEIIALNKNEFNITNFSICKKIIGDYRPDWVINTAAFTAVDLAESKKEECYAINNTGVKNLAESLSNTNGKLLHISTDFVFDGNKNTPYKTLDKCAPKSIYGKSKFEGEKSALKFPRTFILRTSWLYSSYGKNFCLTMLKLHKLFKQKNQPLKVVSDQIGCPTSCETLANICFKFIEIEKNKEIIDRLFHWSDCGVASWFDFAVAIGEIGTQLKLIKSPAKVIPIKSKDYKTDAERPKYSILDCTSTIDLLNAEQIYWRDSLKNVIGSIKKIEL